MKTFLLNDEFQKTSAAILVAAVILMFLSDIFRDSKETVEAVESPVVLFQEEQASPSLVGKSIDIVGEGKNIILIHSDNPDEWGKVLEDDGLGNIAVGLNRSESVAVETEIVP